MQNIQQEIFIGYDVIITEDGFKIIEINSQPGLIFQYFCPIYKNELLKKKFIELIAEKKVGKSKK